MLEPNFEKADGLGISTDLWFKLIIINKEILISS